MAKRLKVAHIITRLELGGAQQNTLYCCAHHNPKKFEVILICGLGGYLDDEARKNSGHYKTYFLSELKHPIRPWWDLLALLKITEILKAEKVDVVHTHSSKAGILGRWAARRAGVRKILHTVHGWGFYPGQFFLTSWIYQSLERWAAGYTHRLITVSAANQEEGLTAVIGTKDQYRVIHSGIAVEKFRLSKAAIAKARKKLGAVDRPLVLVLSNLKKQKAPMDVVRTAERLVEKIPTVLFVWAGDGPLRGEIEKAVRKNRLEKNFLFFGWREDVAELLAGCDALLLTSLHEGLPRVVLQAMAAGKPAVATAVNGTPEAVQNGWTGFLHAPHDAEGMAESLFKILADEDLARKMGQAGKKALKGTFLIKEMLYQIEKIYAEKSNNI